MPSATTNPRPARPLDGLRFELAGPTALTWAVRDHLRRLGAGEGEGEGERTGWSAGGSRTGEARCVLGGGGFPSVRARARWGAPGSGVEDEATAQAATGVMGVHGRRHGTPRGLGVDLLATATGVLTVQGLLAALIGRARGTAPVGHVDTAADRTGLLLVSQYLAAAGADEPEAVELAPGGPPFTSREGVVFELETLDPGAWAAFWRALDAPADAIRAGWRPFQFRYATACAPLPPALHATALAHGMEDIRRAAARSGAEVCRLRTLAERAREEEVGGVDPWALRPLGPGGHRRGSVPGPDAAAASAGGPLAGLTVLEAGRRIQAPLAAHLLGLLGARVVRIEPPGGDPLRGMPPACSGVSARWLALNRGKDAVELDITSPGDRDALRALAAEADVFLHNWAPGKAAGLGLEAEDLSVANPGLVYAYTGGWGGRLPGAPMGTDFMVQARTGVGEAVHPEGEPPVPSLMTLLDLLGGLHGTEAVLAGLLLRERTGHGVRVESSLLGAADTLLAPALRGAARGAAPRRPAGFRDTLPTADGRIAPTDTSAAAAATYPLHTLPTTEALALLRTHGLAATRVVTDLGALPAGGDPRGSGSAGSAFALPPCPPGPIGRDRHGAPTVPDPWSFA